MSLSKARSLRGNEKLLFTDFFLQCDDDDQYKPRLYMHRYENMTIKILYFPHRYRALFLSYFSLNFQHSISQFSQLGSMIRAAAAEAPAKKYFDNIVIMIKFT